MEGGGLRVEGGGRRVQGVGGKRDSAGRRVFENHRLFDKAPTFISQHVFIDWF